MPAWLPLKNLGLVFRPYKKDVIFAVTDIKYNSGNATGFLKAGRDVLASIEAGYNKWVVQIYRYCL